MDRRAPMNMIGKKKAGNSIHALESKGSLLYAACEDGYVRVFDVTTLFWLFSRLYLSAACLNLPIIKKKSMHEIKIKWISKASNNHKA